MGRVERDAKGRVVKGSRSLNPGGRPPDARRLFTSDQLTKDFLELLDEPVSVKIDGKERRMPAILAIYRKMVQEAANGNWQAVKKVVELREKYIHVRTDLLDGLLKRATEIRRFYEDQDQVVPDHLRTLVDEAERAACEGQFKAG